MNSEEGVLISNNPKEERINIQSRAVFFFVFECTKCGNSNTYGLCEGVPVPIFCTKCYTLLTFN